tara:strand:+ start:608 stop:1267 length:660 start_codon:yes stop_codon:yes gene_type:complete
MANSNEVIFNCLSDLEFVEKLIDNKEKEINTLKKNNLYISKLLKKMMEQTINNIIKILKLNLMKYILDNFRSNYIENNLKSCIIHTGDSIYKDRNISDYIVHYEGQTLGRADKHLKKNSIYLFRNRKLHNFRFGGIVKNIKIIREISNNTPALYELEIMKNITINNIKVGNEFSKMDRYKGPGCLKKSALFKLGYEMLGSVCSGINPIKKISFNHNIQL